MNMQKYIWKITPEINQLLIELEALKLSFTNLSAKPLLETSFRQYSLLKSSVYSARIEGFLDTVNSPKKESQNLLTAYHFIFSNRSPQKITLSFIRQLHRLVLKNISSHAGHFRTEPWAIFNQSGGAIYLAPPHFEVPGLMKESVSFINSLSDHVAVKSAIAQFVFEKIHPFADGNGRVGRLLSAFVLAKNSFGFKGLTPFEEYLEEHREDYYYHLETNLDCTGFIQFFLEALIFQSKKDLEKLSSVEAEKAEDSLLPRRREILEIVRDHPECSFDFLQRRFLAINPKTLHNDISCLIKAGFIKKLGATKGVVYSSITIN